MKSRLATLLILGLILLPQPSRAQDPLHTVSPVLAVGSVIQSSMDAIDRVIALALDRLDMTLLSAAMEARAILNASSLQFADAATTSVDELDDQQRRLLSDMQALVKAITSDIHKVAAELLMGQNRALTDIRLIVSDNPGTIYVIAKPALRSDDHIDIRVSGTALSSATLGEMRVLTRAVVPQTVHADDRKIVYRVSMQDIVDLPVFSDDQSDVIELPIAFSYVEESWWPWASDDSRPFSTTALILPKLLGQVKAVFSTSTLGKERRTQVRGPFVSPRVKTRLKWTGIKVGSVDKTWHASPSDGWKIDIDTADYEYVLLFDQCWGRRSQSSWIEKTEHLLRVWTRTMAEDVPGKTCKSKTTIYFDEWRPDRVDQQTTTDVSPIGEGETVVLKLTGEHTRARFSHIEVTSPMFGEKSKILRSSNQDLGIVIDYDEPSQSVYVSWNYHR